MPYPNTIPLGVLTGSDGTSVQLIARHDQPPAAVCLCVVVDGFPKAIAQACHETGELLRGVEPVAERLAFGAFPEGHKAGSARRT